MNRRIPSAKRDPVASSDVHSGCPVQTSEWPSIGEDYAHQNVRLLTANLPAVGATTGKNVARKRRMFVSRRRKHRMPPMRDHQRVASAARTSRHATEPPADHDV